MEVDPLSVLTRGISPVQSLKWGESVVICTTRSPIRTTLNSTLIEFSPFHLADHGETPEIQQLSKGIVQSEGPERIRTIMDWLTDHGYVDGSVQADIMSGFFTLFDAHIMLARNFRPVHVRAPIHCWWQRDGHSGRTGREMQWHEHTDASVSVELLDGLHYDLLYPPAVNAIADQLDAALLQGTATP